MTAESKALEAQKEEVLPSNGEPTRDRRTFVPRTDIYETNEAIFVVADMPGVTPDSVDITLENNVLSIHGMVDSNPPEGYTLAYAEYEEGDYFRKFTISNRIDGNKIEATLNDGVLRLTLPKVQPTQKKISVKSA